MTVAEFATKRVVATTMILVFMVFTGIVSIMNMKQELIPDFDLPMVVVNTTWTGAAAEDVRNQVSDKIEEAALNVDGIKNISTTSSYETSVVIIQFNFGTDTDIKRVQIQAEIDKIKDDLPDDIDDPTVDELDTSSGGSSDMALMIGIRGGDPSLITSFVDEKLEPRLKRNRGIGNVQTFGGLQRRIDVKMDPVKMKAYNLSASEIYSLIQSAHTITPAGTVKDGTKSFILKVEGEITQLEEVQNIIVSTANNQTVRLMDVADVKYGTEDRESYTKYNGESMVAVAIEKSQDGNLVEIAKTARATLEEMKDSFPDGSHYEVLVDNSTRVSDAISNVTSTGIQALIIAVIVLLIFLKDLRASLVVGMSIPISAMFTFFLINTQGVTLNMISLMGLALAIGSLVDNAVVALDNVFDHIQVNKEPAMVASVRGVNEVILPMMASTATSVCVFLPIVLFNGYAKTIFSGIAWSMMFALSASIIVAMLFVPMASSKFLNVEKISRNADKGVYYNKFKNGYKNLISRVLNHRKSVLLGVAVLFIVVVFGLGRTVKTSFFPTIDNKEYAVVATLATGLDLEVAHDVSKQMEEVIKADPVTKDYITIVTTSAAIVNVDVTKDTMKAMDRVRKKLQDLPNVTIALVAEKAGGSGVTKDYEFTVEGEDSTEANRIANAIIADMKGQSWFKDVKSSTEAGYSQAKLILNRTKMESYGLTVSGLTTALFQSVLGTDPVKITQGTESIEIYMQYDDKYREPLNNVMDLEIKASDGVFVRLGDIAKLSYEEGASSISTKNGYEQVTVGTNLDSSKGFNDAAKFIKESFKKANPAKGYKLGTSGNSESQSEMGGELMNAILLSIALIYIVIAVQVESFVLPLIIMLALPLSMIGVIFGLAITRVQLNMFVMIGILMLFGMAVNNSIVLLDFVGGLRDKGYTIRDALVEAAGSRLRPILMTTLTTVLGWLPMAFAIGGGSAGYYQGMSIAVMFGLSFCTLLTLFFIPVCYSLLEERKLIKAEEKEAKKKAKEVEKAAQKDNKGNKEI